MASFFLFVAVYVLLIASRFYRKPFEVANKDHYKDLFIDFLHRGFYQSSIAGTTTLYNLALQGLYRLTQNVDAAFMLLNASCDLFYLVFGLYFFNKIDTAKSIYLRIVAVIFGLYTLNQQSYLSASNDTFMGVFVLILLYIWTIRLKSQQAKSIDFLAMGLMLGLAFATRMTAVYLIPLMCIALWFWWRQSEAKIGRKLTLIALTAFTFLVTTIGFHYPSLLEKHQLSYENKTPGNGLTWIQRNYLGLKKIELGQEPVHRDAIWKNTKFEAVEKYLNKNGANSLPKTYFDAVEYDPLLAAEIGVYNVASVLIRFVRFWGLLFVVPFIGVFARTKWGNPQLPMLLFTVFAVLLSFTCFTFMEFRWFLGYEILIPVGLLLAVGQTKLTESIESKNIIFTLSLLLITVFNLKSIFGS